jgi:wyosine [tRNA(Phe)-imidazoG37] synthetase (radical SAM superfamily)
MPSYIYGPVASRRLGRSLGVDLVPYKTCSYNCIYCQLGHTTVKTIERKEWVPIDAVLSELKDALHTNPDYITLSGSGEPTLHSRAGELIRRIKKLTDIPVAVLTNGSLLWEPEVASALMEADLVVPSLDAYDEESFQYVNRPHGSISFELMVNGLVKFRKSYPGKIWLEVFLLEGITSGPAEIEKMAEVAKRINPDRIQLNTVERPAAEEFAEAVPLGKMEELEKVFGEKANVVTYYHGAASELDFTVQLDDIINLLKRRPCTLDDVASGLGIHRNDALKHLNNLVMKGLVEIEIEDGDRYFKPKRVE